jgi:hypothetical protein
MARTVGDYGFLNVPPNVPVVQPTAYDRVWQYAVVVGGGVAGVTRTAYEALTAAEEGVAQAVDGIVTPLRAIPNPVVRDLAVEFATFMRQSAITRTFLRLYMPAVISDGLVYYIKGESVHKVTKYVLSQWERVVRKYYKGKSLRGTVKYPNFKQLLAKRTLARIIKRMVMAMTPVRSLRVRMLRNKQKLRHINTAVYY